MSADVRTFDELAALLMAQSHSLEYHASNADGVHLKQDGSPHVTHVRLMVVRFEPNADGSYIRYPVDSLVAPTADLVPAAQTLTDRVLLSLKP